MNLVEWVIRRLDYRCGFLTTFLNMYGETEVVKISLAEKGKFSYFRKIIVDRIDKPNSEILEINLDDIESLNDTMFHFEMSDGTTGILIIPMPQEDDDGD